jgi:hypothetical protein
MWPGGVPTVTRGRNSICSELLLFKAASHFLNVLPSPFRTSRTGPKIAGTSHYCPMVRFPLNYIPNIPDFRQELGMLANRPPIKIRLHFVGKTEHQHFKVSSFLSYFWRLTPDLCAFPGIISGFLQDRYAPIVSGTLATYTICKNRDKVGKGDNSSRRNGKISATGLNSAAPTNSTSSEHGSSLNCGAHERLLPC